MLKSHLMPHLYWHGLVKVSGEIINNQLSNNQYSIDRAGGRDPESSGNYSALARDNMSLPTVSLQLFITKFIV